MKTITNYIFHVLDSIVDFAWVNYGIKKIHIIYGFAAVLYGMIIVCLVKGHEEFLVHSLVAGFILRGEAKISKRTVEEQNALVSLVRYRFIDYFSYFILPCVVFLLTFLAVAIVAFHNDILTAATNLVYVSLFWITETYISNKPRKKKEPKLVHLPEFA